MKGNNPLPTMNRDAGYHTTVLSDDQIDGIKAFCDEIRDRLENATLEQKRQLIELLDVRGTLAIENEEKVIYVKCHLGQQLVSAARTLPWQCNHKGHPIVIRVRLVLPPSYILESTENPAIPHLG